MDAATGGDAWETPLAHVSLAGIAPRGSIRTDGYAALRRIDQARSSTDCSLWQRGFLWIFS